MPKKNIQETEEDPGMKEAIKQKKKEDERECKEMVEKGESSTSHFDLLLTTSQQGMVSVGQKKWSKS